MPLCFTFGALLPSWGQVDYGPLSGQVWDDTAVQDIAQRRQALVGAVVTVISPRDTLHTTTDYQGLFYLKRVTAGYVRVEVSYLGYETYKRDSVRIAPRFGIQRPLRIYLKPAAQEIDQVVVEGRYFTFNVGIRLNKASQREFGRR